MGKPISGYGLSTLLHNWVDAINNGAVPNIENSFEQVALQENDRLVKKAVELQEDEFSNRLLNKLPCDSTLIKDLHKELKLKTILHFTSNVVGGDIEKFKMRILDKCKSIRLEVEENNLQAYKDNCEEVMSGIIDEIEVSIASGRIDSIEKLSKEFSSIEGKYRDNFPNITQKTEIWLSYVNKWYEFAAESLQNKLIRKNRDLQDEVNKKFEDSKNKLSE